jgi:hypothetical protein
MYRNRSIDMVFFGMLYGIDIFFSVFCGKVWYTDIFQNVNYIYIYKYYIKV